MLKISLKEQARAPRVQASIASPGFGAIGDEPWYKLKWPWLIRSRMHEVNNEIKSLGSDIRRYLFWEGSGSTEQPGVCTKIVDGEMRLVRPCLNDDGRSWDEFIEEWTRFVDEWERYYINHLNLRDHLWTSEYDVIKDFHDRLVQWHDSFIAMGGNRPSGSPKPKPVDKGGFPFHMVVYSVLGIASVWGTVKIVQALRNKG